MRHGIAWLVEKGGRIMSRNTIGIVIDRLLTDENLRIRFVDDRIQTLMEAQPSRV